MIFIFIFIFCLASISCGQFEFYVQLTFEKPFKGLVYAYKTLKNIDNQQQQQQQQQQHGQQQQQYYGNYYYPIEILDSCTIRGNGESIIYLELSFLSECVEKLLNTMMNGGNIPHHQNDDDNNTDVQSDNHYDQTSSSTTTSTTTSTLMDDEDNDDGKTSSLMNDGFINTHVSDFSLYLTCQSINQSINFAVSLFQKKRQSI